MSLQNILSEKVKEAVKANYDATLETVEFQATRKDFEGDITVVIFPMLRTVKGNPVQIGETIGQYLVDNVTEVSKFNVVKGFLNVVLSDTYYLDFFGNVTDFSKFGRKETTADAMMVEYASPNTNKPLHLGHVRNVLLGYSVAEILKAAGKKVYKTQIINDRGIHICKSMLAWKLFAPNGSDGKKETPKTTLNPELRKGDKLVGNYYVRFDKEMKIQAQPIYENYLSDKMGAIQNAAAPKIKEIRRKIKELKNTEKPKLEKIKEEEAKLYEFAKNHTKIMSEASVMLRKWEAGDLAVVDLWKTMNGWVYEGFDATYKAIGVNFDKNYYESDTYLLGKEFIKEGLTSGVFKKKDDGSVWCDLTAEGLDEKIVLRSDGTAVYMTQDIGTAIQRVKDFPDINGMIYTVGNEQDYHFQVLFLILKKLGFSWADNLFHLSYGMVDLPSGKMKSREGTVVDADDLIASMAQTAGEISEELGKIDAFSKEEKTELYSTIGLGALKYYILKVDPKKRILFNPEESVDFQGNTGPFIQYTYARIQSILNTAGVIETSDFSNIKLASKEKEVLKVLALFPETIQLAATNYSPALIANYTYDLVKNYNSFFQNVSIFKANTKEEQDFRVQLSAAVGDVIKTAFTLLGIRVPNRM